MEKQKKGGSVPAIHRAIRILKLLEREPNLKHGQIREKVGDPKIPAASLTVILTALQEHALVVKNPETEGYKLDVGLVVLSSTVLKSLDIAQHAKPALKSLVKQKGAGKTPKFLCAHLSIMSSQRVVCVALERSDDDILLAKNFRGRVFDLHATATGKVFLAFLIDEEVQLLLPKITFTKLTEKTTTNQTALLKQVKQIKKNGYAVDLEETTHDVSCISIPIFSRNNKNLVASLTVTGLTKNFKPKDREQIVKSMKKSIEIINDAAKDKLYYTMR